MVKACSVQVPSAFRQWKQRWSSLPFKFIFMFALGSGTLAGEVNMEKLSLYTDTLHWNSGLYRPFRCQNIQKILGAMKTVSSIFMGVQTT